MPRPALSPKLYPPNPPSAPSCCPDCCPVQSSVPALMAIRYRRRMNVSFSAVHDSHEGRLGASSSRQTPPQTVNPFTARGRGVALGQPGTGLGDFTRIIWKHQILKILPEDSPTLESTLRDSKSAMETLLRSLHLQMKGKK